MKKPNFYKQEISDYCKKFLTQKKYGDFAPLLEEIFQRRAYAFGFDNSHILDEIIDFSNNIEKIYLKKEHPKRKTALGCCFHKEKKIEIYEKGVLNEYGEMDEESYHMLFETLTHEVYHGISGRNNSLIRWDDKEQYEKNIAMNEVWVESAANRTARSTDYEDFRNYRAKTDGYSSITFVSNLLSAAIGMTEKSILKIGIQGGCKNADLFQGIDSQYFESRDYAAGYLENVMFNLDVVYNILYNNKNGKNLSREEKTIFKVNLSELYRNMYSLAISRNDDDRDILSATEKMKFRYNKMDKIINDSLQRFIKDGRLSGGDLYEITKQFKEEKEIFKNQVIAINRFEKKRK